MTPTEELEQLAASITPGPKVKPLEWWQPIENAPRDGTAILASGLDHGKGPCRHYSVVEWMDFGCESGWYPDEDSEPHIYLTHWMPLPEPPGEPAMTSTNDLIARLRVPLDVTLRAGAPELDEYDEERLEAADRLTALQDRVNELETVARRAIEEWAGWVEDQLSGTSMYSDAMAEVDAASAVLAKGEKG